MSPRDPQGRAHSGASPDSEGQDRLFHEPQQEQQQADQPDVSPYGRSLAEQSVQSPEPHGFAHPGGPDHEDVSQEGQQPQQPYPARASREPTHPGQPGHGPGYPSGQSGGGQPMPGYAMPGQSGQGYPGPPPGGPGYPTAGYPGPGYPGPGYPGPGYPGPGHPGFGYPMAGHPAQVMNRNALAGWALATGIAGFFLCGLPSIAAIILGAFSRKAVSQGRATNGAMGTTGMVLGIVGAALWSLVLIGPGLQGLFLGYGYNF